MVTLKSGFRAILEGEIDHRYERVRDLLDDIDSELTLINALEESLVQDDTLHMKLVPAGERASAAVSQLRESIPCPAPQLQLIRLDAKPSS